MVRLSTKGRTMKDQPETQRCTCQLCVQTWQFVGGSGVFEPQPFTDDEMVRTEQSEPALPVVHPELNRALVAA